MHGWTFVPPSLLGPRFTFLPTLYMFASTLPDTATLESTASLIHNRRAVPAQSA